MDKKGLGGILPYFNEKIRLILKRLDGRQDIQEIRLRAGRAVSARINSTEVILAEDAVTAADIEYSFRAVCEYSIHSYMRELSEGYITVEGGHRVGLCGTAVTKGHGIETLKYISGMNFRIASERIGSADRLMKEVFSEKPCGVIIIGPPASGKTTVLRDVCRQLGDKTSLSVIDERGELAAVYRGSAQNRLGRFTDVFDGYPKADGISVALRVMTPEYIVVDEIGTDEDVKAIEGCIHSGVQIIATAHAGNRDELLSRKHISELVRMGAFGKIVTLGSKNVVGKIIDICEV